MEQRYSKRINTKQESKSENSFERIQVVFRFASQTSYIFKRSTSAVEIVRNLHLIFFLFLCKKLCKNRSRRRDRSVVDRAKRNSKVRPTNRMDSLDKWCGANTGHEVTQLLKIAVRFHLDYGNIEIGHDDGSYVFQPITCRIDIC